MSKGEAVEYISNIYYDNDRMVPIPKILQWISKNSSGEVDVYISTHELAASASNETILIDDDTNTVLTVLWDIDGLGSDAITIKTNGATNARAVKPLRVISNNLTSITASNSDSVSKKDLGIARVVISNTTNTTLKESEQ